MYLIKYENSSVLNEYKWLSYDYLPDSNGDKFELVFDNSENAIDQSILSFYFLIKDYLKEIIVGPFNPESCWGNYCITNWNIETDTFCYSSHDQKDSSLRYHKMLKENNIEPSYIGFGKCLDWDSFLLITLDCLMDHSAPYSFMFYIPKHKYCVLFPS